MYSLIDSHVHFYARYNVEVFLKNAINNFQHYAYNSDSKKNIGVLILTESENEDSFKNLRDGIKGKTNYQILETLEDISYWVKYDEKFWLLIIKGQQIISKENLEVLSLFANENVSNDLPISSTLVQVQNNHSIAVLPWGFGKWFGKRGQIIRKIINSSQPNSLILGDNGGRPSVIPFLKNYNSQNVQFILPGSDPLNIKNGQSRAGSYGIILPADIEQDFPAKSLYTSIKNLKSQPQYFGKSVNLFGFLVNQISLRLNKII